MNGFVDETTITVSSGKGGNGAVSFRREKYVPKGGPDGGDGGKGGDVVFITKKNVKTLSHVKMKRVFKAGNGKPGEGRKKHGKDGEDVEIEVPPGTVVKDHDSGAVIKDLSGPQMRWKFLEGGRGGKGNVHYKSSVRQAPRYSQKGKAGVTVQLSLELRIIADVGLVGFPNAGKSTLLATLTNANPKIGDYPFTTKIPNIGVIKAGYTDIIVADIPGLIEGASAGAGLGIRFLKHITRTKGLAFLIDVSEPDFEDRFSILMEEMGSYSRELMVKKRIIVATKIDKEGTEENLSVLRDQYPEETVIAVSSYTRNGIEELKKSFLSLAS
jgi:GTP-binding protein